MVVSIVLIIVKNRPSARCIPTGRVPYHVYISSRLSVAVINIEQKITFVFIRIPLNLVFAVIGATDIHHLRRCQLHVSYQRLNKLEPNPLNQIHVWVTQI